MKKLAEYLGGSHLYGLNTAQSDEDIRYVYLNEELRHVIGMDRHDHVDKRNKDEDSFGMELRGFLALLRKTNTQVLELLYADEDAFSILDPEFKRLVLMQRHRFIDSDRFYKSLKGYIYTEGRLARGERKGKIGGKRCEALLEHGYSPKNFTQLFRLCFAGTEFYRTGVFPTNIRKYDENVWNFLMEVKTQPGLHSVEELQDKVNEWEKVLDDVYERSTVKFKFDDQYAHELCYCFYKPILDSYVVKL